MSTNVYRLDEALGFIISRAFFRLKAGLRQEFKSRGYDVTPEQWGVLCRLWEEEGITQNELANRTIKDKTTITRILDSLEAKELIVRQRDGRDRRSHRVMLTPRGKALEKELVPIVLGFNADIFGWIGDEDRQTAIRVLNAIHDKLGERLGVE